MFYIWKVFDRRKSKIKCLAIITFIFFVAGFLLLDCFCSDKKCSWSLSVNSEIRDDSQFKSLGDVNNFSEKDLDKHFNFNQDTDVFVFLHIQKTGGTNFGLNLVKNTSLKEPCVCFENRKRCDCRTSKNYLWIISRHSNGWVCGLHADWTELHDCVPVYLNRADGIERKRRYLYFTILREPIQRYLSEWKHVQRGSTWISAKLKCGGRKATRKEVPLCFKGKNWMNVSFDEFTTCKSNLALNRQTRMVADLRLVGCYDRSVIPDDANRNKIMLESAKDNLRSMTFFGLTEYQIETSFLFEYTFGIKFTTNFTQVNDTRASKADVSSAERERLLKLNSLDVELYSYARDLFLARVNYARMKLKQEKMAQTNSDQNINEMVVSSDSKVKHESTNFVNFSPANDLTRYGRKNFTFHETSRDDLSEGGYGYNDEDNSPYRNDDYDMKHGLQDIDMAGDDFLAGNIRGGDAIGGDAIEGDAIGGEADHSNDIDDEVRSQSITSAR